MVGFAGPSGRVFSDSQRRAMFASGFESPRRIVVYSKNLDSDNKFAVGATLVGAGKLASTATGAAGSGLEASLVSGGAASTALASTGLFRRSGEKKADGKSVNEKKPVPVKKSKPYKRSISDSVVSNVGDGFLGIGEPYTPTVSELATMDMSTMYSKEPHGEEIDIDKVRWALKKQYPDGDVDTKVIMLQPDEYMETALRENPGREREALMSNGFYSPKDDKTYLEVDPIGLNTVRAMIHEFVHDMSDDGVGDDMLNEGYADYVSYKIMTEELNVSEERAKVTLGYPEEAKKIERMVQVNGRKNVDNAFLNEHSLDGLSLK